MRLRNIRHLSGKCKICSSLPRPSQDPDLQRARCVHVDVALREGDDDSGLAKLAVNSPMQASRGLQADIQRLHETPQREIQ